MRTNALNLVHWPTGICFCTGIILQLTLTSHLWEEGHDPLGSLMGKGEKIDFPQGLDRALDHVAQLDDGQPLDLILASVSSVAQHTCNSGPRSCCPNLSGSHFQVSHTHAYLPC